MPLPTHANCKFISCKDSRSWLEHHAEVFGEQSPMSGAIYLPYGRRSEYYYLYVFERTHVDHGVLSHLDNKPADQKTFMSAWRTECYWIQLASRTSMFVGCACCKLLQNLLSSTSRANDATMQALRHRLGRRYAFQSAQRLADEKLMEQCRRSNNLEW